MLSLTKKSDAQPVAAPLWHANFRNFERLPDTKVVRTTFFINTAAIAVAALLLIWLGSREVTGREIREKVAEAERQIAANSKQNAEGIRLSKEFAQEQKKIAEAATFVKSPITVLEFLAVLGETLPREVAIDSVDTRVADPKNSIFQLRGRVAGSPDQASGLASSYVESLKNHPKINETFDPVTLNGIERDPSGTFLVFDITLKIKPEKF